MHVGKPVYFATAGTDKIISTGPAILEKIIIGADVASAVIEVSDSPTDGNGNIQLRLAGSTLMTSCKGEVAVGATFQFGISADLTNQTNVTFVWRPMAS
jgi:hypothetical protein